ncbi:MAG: DUF481 domain-containing protein [Vicinamibacterales bacterium]|nr:DUF481 domain-containing protein [Vicinamibacterales bacterium]
MRRWFGFVIAICAVLSGVASAQPAPVGGAPPATVKIFLDCRGRCDGNYIRTELGFVDHVTERAAANVHILVTTRGNGGGGTEYSISFIGQGPFEHIQDSAVYNTRQDDSDDDVRRGLVRALKLGLVRYLALTPLRDSLDVTFTPPSGKERQAAQAASDPWDFWVFRIRGNGDMAGEESSTSLRLSGNASASRVTEGWKTALSASLNYRRNRYSFDDDDDYVSITRDSWLGGVLIKSIGSHWGAGVRASTSTSTYNNQARTLRGGPAVEYNLFPYSQSTRRQLTLRYALGANYFEYEEPTIYGKSKETLLGHSFAVDLNMRQPWGQLDLEALASQYLPDTNKSRLTFETSLEVRLIKGLSLNVGADTSFIRDQVFLPAEGATAAEVLLRQRQIATSYDYRFSVGFTYSFGSVYNNVVNSRLAGF